MNERPDMTDWEDQINALMDGELDDGEAESLKSEAGKNQALAQAIVEAYQLHQLMAAMPQERAPDSLRRKLAAIPLEQSRAARAADEFNAQGPKRGSLAWLQPRWVMALAAVPLVLALVVNLSGPQAPTEAELAQARQELAVALSYLQSASQVTNEEIRQGIGTGIDPVRTNTVRGIVDQLEFNEEQEA